MTTRYRYFIAPKSPLLGSQNYLRLSNARRGCSCSGSWLLYSVLAWYYQAPSTDVGRTFDCRSTRASSSKSTDGTHCHDIIQCSSRIPKPRIATGLVHSENIPIQPLASPLQELPEAPRVASTRVPSQYQYQYQCQCQTPHVTASVPLRGLQAPPTTEHYWKWLSWRRFSLLCLYFFCITAFIL